MRIHRFILLLATGIYGCNSAGGDSTPAAPSGLQMSSGLQQYSGTSVPLPANTETGLFITASGQDPTTATAEFSNLKFTAGTAGKLLRENPVQLTQNASYTVYAYAPYQETADNPESIPFSYGTDVLGCPVPAQIRNAGPGQYSGLLQFVHCTAQIRFVVKISNDTLGELSPTSVLKVTGFFPEGRLDISDAHISGQGEPSDATAMTAAAVYDDTDGKYRLETRAVCFFILPGSPQTLQLRVTHDGVTRTGSITRIFNSGESYTYTVSVGRQSELTLNAVLTPWIDENEIIDFN